MTRRILTDSDIELLTGEADDLAERALEQRKIRMRSRIRKAIEELNWLSTRLDPEDREKIFSPPQNAEQSPTVMFKAAGGLFRFAYLGLKEQQEELIEENIPSYIEWAENQWSVEKNGRKDHADVTFKVEHDYEDPGLGDLAERFKADESLSQKELIELMHVKAQGSVFPEIDMRELREALAEVED